MTGVDVLAETRAQLTAAWDVRGIDVATMAADSGAMHATQRRLMTGPMMTSTLPPLLVARGDVPPSFRLGRTLGRGGMGIVRAATQQALDREVAIKCLRDDDEGTRAGPQLLREARVVGSLEHPNIVPVHALGADEHGRPILVMKRIDGVAWDEALDGDDPGADPEAFLRKHLAIFRQVISAVHFAHEKGVVHRDVKPANVMLGRHDEVYLVDWGIAVTHREDAVRGVPHAREIGAIEGTPAYMAPEMAAADGAGIGPRTDVYLLGATLFDVLNGRPPHEGKSLIDVLTYAFGAESREHEAWVPSALTEICDRAMARDPADRFETALALGQALDVVLEHRASVRLTDEANVRLEELASVSDRFSEANPDDLHAIHTLFAECRFAFSHALATWPENEAARHGLRRSVEMMVEVELARDAPEAAALLLRDLPEPAPELQQNVNAMLELRRKEGARLERLVRDADVHIGSSQRGALSIVLGVGWAAGFIVLGALYRRELLSENAAHMLVVVLITTVVAGVGMYVLRDTLVNRASWEQMFSIVLLQLAHIIAISASWALALPLLATSATMAIVGGVAFTTGTFFIDRAYVPMVASCVIGLVMMILWPAFHLEILGIGGGIGAALSARNLLRVDRQAQPLSRAASRR